MSADTPQIDAESGAKPTKPRHPKKGRSGVTNGTALLVGVDGRSRHAKRFRDLIKALTDEAGGNPSVTDQNIIKQCAAMCLKAEMLQASLVNGNHVSAEDLCRTTSEARRLTELIRSKAGKPKEAPQSAIRDRLSGVAA